MLKPAVALLLATIALGSAQAAETNLIRLELRKGQQAEVRITTNSAWENSAALWEVGGKVHLDLNNQNGQPNGTAVLCAEDEDRVFIIHVHHKPGPSNKDLPWLPSPIHVHHRSDDGKLVLYGAEDGGDASFCDVVIKVRFSDIQPK